MIHFFLTFIFFNGTFFLMHIVGMHGHPRRIADPDDLSLSAAGRASSGMNQFMTINAFLLGLTQIIFALQLLLQPGRRAQGAGTTPGTPTRSSGRRRRRRRTTTSSGSRRLPCPVRIQRAGRRGRLSAPDPAAAGVAGPLDPVMA